MKITFIGTGSGRVELKSYHTSFFVQSKNTNLLIDCGDLVSRALLDNKINFNSITHIIISHNHPDHFSGLPNLINQMHLAKRKRKLSIYGHKNLISQTKKLLLMNYVFPEKLKFNLNMCSFDYEKSVAVSKQIIVTPIRNNHIYNKYNIKAVSEKLFESASFFIKTPNKSLLITSDLKDETDLNLFDNCHADIVILETSHVNLQKVSNYKIISESKKVYLTHYESEKANQIAKWIEEYSDKIKPKIIIAREKETIVV